MGIINTKLRGAIFVFFLTLVLAAALSWTKYKINFLTVENESSAVNTSAATARHEAKPLGQTSGAASSERATESNGVSLSFLESSVRDWERARGHFTTSDTAVYETYSNEVLIDLGNKNDLKALEVLRHRMLENNNAKESVRYSQMAVALGSTAALDTLSRMVFILNPSDGDPKKFRALTLEAIAVTKLIAMRGDVELAKSSKKLLSTSYDADLSLTDEEEKYVEERAKEAYAKYQAIRNAKGLGAFDNSTSSTIFEEK